MSTPITKELEPWEVLHPNGFSMFHCDAKKANWYLKKKLAQIVGERKIKLLFKPKGPGEDASVKLQKSISCVCCSSKNHLTKHHIIPTQYRKQLPIEYKEHYSYDVVLLCKDCHEVYERKADIFKKQIETETGVLENKKRITLKNKILRTFKRHFKNNLHQLALEKLKNSLIEYDNNPDISIEHYEFLKNEKLENYNKKVTENYDPQVFIEMWRKHFLEEAKPKNMSKGWKIETIKLKI